MQKPPAHGVSRFWVPPLTAVGLLVAAGDLDAVDAALPSPAVTADQPARGIQDNSFLVEEAYNQGPGVVQHILNVTRTVDKLRGPDDHEWGLVFTQEWPAFSQTHQLSYTVPYLFRESGEQGSDGVGDVLLNYRFQALRETPRTPAFAPRFSLILPTGDEDEGFGDGTLGFQFNLPLSKIVSDRWTLHGNAGLTFLPDVGGNDLVGYNLGASAIYALTPTFNLMLEAVTSFDQAARVGGGGGTERTVAAVLSPGLRYAFNHPNDAQTVVGLAAPIGLTGKAPDYGVILYVSFEHFFHRPRLTGTRK